MELIKYQEQQAIVTKDFIQISPFDKIAAHKDAEKYFAYIFYLCDWKSPYATKERHQREAELKEDILEGKEPTDLLKEGIAKYDELNQTDSSLLLQSARKAVKTLRDYFENVDPEADKDPGKSAKDLMSNLKNVGDIIQKIEEWEDQIKKEQSKGKTRKGVELSKYNK